MEQLPYKQSSLTTKFAVVFFKIKSWILKFNNKIEENEKRLHPSLLQAFGPF